MAPTYILHYFNYKGRGESIRLLLHYKHVDFQDPRYPPDGAEWQALKAQTPSGQLPIMEIVSDGKRLSQSIAILRYLGREFGLHPSSGWDQARLDEIVGCAEDATVELRVWRWEKDETKREALRQELIEKILPPKLEKLAELMISVSGADSTDFQFVNGATPTWVDFFIAGKLEFIETAILQKPDSIALLNVTLAQFLQRIRNLDGVKQYVAQRPPTLL